MKDSFILSRVRRERPIQRRSVFALNEESFVRNFQAEVVPQLLPSAPVLIAGAGGFLYSYKKVRPIRYKTLRGMHMVHKGELAQK